jgi:hypothetical protein
MMDVALDDCVLPGTVLDEVEDTDAKRNASRKGEPSDEGTSTQIVWGARRTGHGNVSIQWLTVVFIDRLWQRS